MKHTFSLTVKFMKETNGKIYLSLCTAGVQKFLQSKIAALWHQEEDSGTDKEGVW